MSGKGGVGSHWHHSSTHVNSLFSAIAIGCLIGTIPRSTVSTCVHHVFLLLQGRSEQTQGALSVLAFTTFFFFYKDDPSRHRNVSPTELQKITSDKQVQRKESIPYGYSIQIHSSHIFVNLSDDTSVPTYQLFAFRAIIKDPCILAVWLAASGGNLGFQVFVLYGPTYINKVLHFNVTSTGFVTALPHILSAALKFVVTNPTVDQIAYTAAIVFSGINVVGVVKCAQLVARQHAHFVMAVMSFHLCIIILFVPIAVSIVCPDNTPEQWSNLFFGISVIVVVANVPFAFLASSEPAPWTGNENLKSDSTQQG
ncbi:hypothetical protein NECAME_01055 [Necator americanus]|uniref:Uncharacterized protein n=1 Tax=Necator americanus TaxID=51031 RepID=W2SN22_NECAM|nr:hypothetical protein NECAME_01055 [Necator americanus]ETN70107.1 hypothetical protein NECAME_01055 [Necator americanus]